MEEKSIQHFYVFTYLDGKPCFERTCGTRKGATNWVEEYKRRGHLDAFYMVNCLPKEWWY